MDSSICQVYEDIIQSLEEEIKLLAEKYEDSQQESTFFSDEEILMSMYAFFYIKSFQREFQGESKGCESPSDLKAQLESLETDLSFLMKFTGIQFTSHSKKTVEKTRNRTVRKHRLSGNCHSLSFQLEFQLLEMRVRIDISFKKQTKKPQQPSKQIKPQMAKCQCFLFQLKPSTGILSF
ncbi:hypothetical protein QYF61_015570 [Mycteria americana]|uniref:Centromere protein P n=1 Tax=Mycteria americana TaxID=33587 RepID=A0AAN7RS80_MYCAM|nr:hypothetical protein QYF61_015570 [Mycteria americana]